jgi:hypothetical protein
MDFLMLASILAIPFCIFFPRIQGWWYKLQEKFAPASPNREQRRRNKN